MNIRYISETEAQVSKAFAKKAVIFGTEEFKLWYEYKKLYPDAHMEVKKIKKNPLKQNTTKNLTYRNMAIFILEQDNSDELMEEFKSTYKQSKVQANPYRYVLAWFLGKFENHNSYMEFFNNLEADHKAKEFNGYDNEFETAVNL